METLAADESRAYVTSTTLQFPTQVSRPESETLTGVSLIFTDRVTRVPGVGSTEYTYYGRVVTRPPGWESSRPGSPPS